MREMKDSGIKWVGEIPDGWYTMANKYVMGKIKHINPLYNGEDILSLTMNGVIVRDLDAGGKMPSSFDGYQTLYPGNLLMCLFDYDVTPRCIGLIRNHGVTSPAYSQFKMNPGYSAHYYYYYYLMVDHTKALLHRAKNLRHSFTEDQLGAIAVPVPPVKEQRAIAAFLDAKCAEIDALSADIQSEIDTLEAYKRSVITEAVTKGLDKTVTMKDSGIKWVGEVPEHWGIYRMADIYADRNERGNENLPLLSVSINSGVSDKELSDEEQDRVFLRSEDKTKYKRVYPGDITYNMMRAWQGAFGAVRIDGMVSPAYVVAKPTGRVEIDSRYIEALIRSPMGIEEMNRYSYGIMDFRKRLYWPQFRTIKICLPQLPEQQEIADYIDSKAAEIDVIIKQKRDQLTTLTDYKKSIIYEYVTGKKEVV